MQFSSIGSGESVLETNVIRTILIEVLEQYGPPSISKDDELASLRKKESAHARVTAGLRDANACLREDLARTCAMLAASEEKVQEQLRITDRFERALREISRLGKDLAAVGARETELRNAVDDLRDLKLLYGGYWGLGTFLLGCWASYDSAGKGREFAVLLIIGLVCIAACAGFVEYRRRRLAATATAGPTDDTHTATPPDSAPAPAAPPTAATRRPAAIRGTGGDSAGSRPAPGGTAGGDGLAGA